MANAVEGYERERSCHIPMPMPGFSRDLLQNFISGTRLPPKFNEKLEEDGDVELSLGLSLNGRFGVDPSPQKLVRSSSIPDFLNPSKVSAEIGGAMMSVECGPILRTCSLPMETEDECRKRKAMQSLRRMEAKRKRNEKQRNSRGANCKNGRVSFEGRSNGDREVREGSRRKHHKEHFLKESSDDIIAAKEGPLKVSGDDVAVAKVATFGMSNREEDGKGADFKDENDNNGSDGSQASASSGISEFESLRVKGTNKCAGARSPSTVQSQPDNNPRSPSRTTARPGYSSNSSAPVGTAVNEPAVPGDGVNASMRDVLLNMPCVSTRGDGPDGKKIEGFLYRYKKGEEVKIVCVCHGRFLSPAEFVKHAGGSDVSHPLKHIVVNAFPSFQ